MKKKCINRVLIIVNVDCHKTWDLGDRFILFSHVKWVDWHAVHIFVLLWDIREVCAHGNKYKVKMDIIYLFELIKTNGKYFDKYRPMVIMKKTQTQKQNREKTTTLHSVVWINKVVIATKSTLFLKFGAFEQGLRHEWCYLLTSSLSRKKNWRKPNNLSSAQHTRNKKPITNYYFDFTSIQFIIFITLAHHFLVSSASKSRSQSKIWIKTSEDSAEKHREKKIFRHKDEHKFQ